MATCSKLLSTFPFRQIFSCRSVYGGFVRWLMGNREDGGDSIAVQLQPASHWPGLKVIICVASDHRKTTSSSLGMRNSVKTSELIKYRAQYSVPTRYKKEIHYVNMSRVIKTVIIFFVYTLFPYYT